MTGSEICTTIISTVKERIHSDEFREKYRIGNCFTRIRKLTMGIVMMFLLCSKKKSLPNCKGLREVSIPSSVESIGDHAFGVYFHFWHEKGYHFPLEEYRQYKGFRIFCVKGSTAQLYAWENHLTCFS